jgi:hypothetical protein
VTYEELRRAGRALIPKIYASPARKEFDMLKAGKKLTVPISGRTFLFEGETDMNALADFWIHEFRHGGKRMIERCQPEEMDLTPLERELLRAHQQSRTSLFEVIEALPGEHRVRLCDVLEPERAEVRLTDVGLSESLVRLECPVLLFFRVIAACGFEMTSGVSFVFRQERKPMLLQAYRERMRTVTPADWTERRFVFFYRKHREFGEEQVYQEAPGTA